MFLSSLVVACRVWLRVHRTVRVVFRLDLGYFVAKCGLWRSGISGRDSRIFVFVLVVSVSVRSAHLPSRGHLGLVRHGRVVVFCIWILQISLCWCLRARRVCFAILGYGNLLFHDCSWEWLIWLCVSQLGLLVVGIFVFVFVTRWSFVV